MAAPTLGINSLWWNSWACECPTADILKLGKAPYVPGTTTPVALDADGCPSADFQLVITQGNEAYWNGVHHLRFKGQATITNMGNAAVSNQSYDAGTNITTADVTIGSSGTAQLRFTATKRIPADSPGTGLTEIALMLPGTTYGVDVFNPDFLAAIGPFGIVRLMHAMLNGTASDDSTQSTWGQRTSPRGPSCCRSQYGIPVEYAMLLARIAGVDPWINISYYADATMHSYMALAARYGTDGLLPYTGDYGSTYHETNNPRPAPIDWDTWTPADTEHYPPLPAGRHIYIEFGNELWNWLYPQTTALRDDAVAEYNAGDAYHYGLLGGSNPGYLMLGRHGRKHKEMADTWRSVWGDAAMNTIVRPMLCGQMGNLPVIRGQGAYIATVYGGHAAAGTAVGPLVTVEDGRLNTYGNPAWPVSRYVYSLNGSVYADGADYATQSGRITSFLTPALQEMKAAADALGVAAGAYEGGTQSNTGYTAAWLETILVELVHAVRTALGANCIYVHHPLGPNSGAGLSPSTSLRTPATYPRWAAINTLAAEETSTPAPNLAGVTGPVAAGTDIDVTWNP